MKNESGRSLIEILGVLAISGVMVAATLGVYNNIRNRQTRTIAIAELKQITENTKLLLSPMGDYSFVSIDYLITAGALKNSKAPIGGDDWSITPGLTNTDFSINLTELSKSECNFFVNIPMDFVYKISVNGYENDNGNHCFSTGGNRISLFAE